MTNQGKVQISGTKYRWDRNWLYYRVVAVLGEEKDPSGWPEVSGSEVDAYKARHKSNWKSFIFELNTPISVNSDVTHIIDTGKIRIYPPFQLNRKARITHVLDEITIPVGVSNVTETMQIPTYAVKGLQSDARFSDDSICYGLRIDCIDGLEYDDALEFFLRVVRQYTKQWWVASSQNPFDTGLRMSFEIENDFRPRDILRRKGAETIEAPWFGSAATQQFIGIEQPLSAQLWNEVARCVVLGYGLEDALQYFLNAVVSFMGYEDNQAVLNMALMFEVAENKMRILNNFKTLSKNKDILKLPSIATNDDIGVFRMIITDRDNIAHGRKPYHFYSNPKVMIDYLEKSADFIDRYLLACAKFPWEKVVKTAL